MLFHRSSQEDYLSQEWRDERKHFKKICDLKLHLFGESCVLASRLSWAKKVHLWLQGYYLSIRIHWQLLPIAFNLFLSPFGWRQHRPAIYIHINAHRYQWPQIYFHVFYFIFYFLLHLGPECNFGMEHFSIVFSIILKQIFISPSVFWIIKHIAWPRVQNLLIKNVKNNSVPFQHFRRGESTTPTGQTLVLHIARKKKKPS